jgi:hypothetical protein
LSLIGIRKQPKGFAIAGLLIGLVGLIELALFGFLVFSTYQVGKNAGSFLQQIPVTLELYEEAGVVRDKWVELDRLPTQTEGDEILKGKRDFTGNQLIYETDGESFSIRTAGPDDTLHTDDDAVVGPFFNPEEVPTGMANDPEDFDSSSIEEMFEDIEDQQELEK